MKKLIIQSNSPEDDDRVAAVLQKEMLEGDANQIVWYSDFGLKVAEIKKTVAENSKEITEVLGKHYSTQKNLANFATDLVNVKIEIDEIKNKLNPIIKWHKEEIKKKKLEIKEKNQTKEKD